MYKLPDHLPLWTLIIMPLALAAASGFALLRAGRNPYLVTGWFWFLGTLVPTIGLVQVGPQAMADRYMYIPSIGLFLLVIWGLGDLLSSAATAPPTAAKGLPRFNLLNSINSFNLSITVCVASLTACLLCTWYQVKYWHDGETLYRHA